MGPRDASSVHSGPVVHRPTAALPSRDWKLAAAVSVAGLLLLVAGWFAYASHSNEVAAGGWKQRAIEFEEQVNGLRTLIGERSAQLNERTRQANRLAANLRSTRLALRRSEGDVTSLARRQRQLANDKAQLQDQRRMLQQQATALEGIASLYIDCKSSLIDVINSLVYQDYSSATYEIDIARSDCTSAADALSAYLAAYS
jgi:chromosome segregation ATPase